MVLRPRPGELALTRRIAPTSIVLVLLLGLGPLPARGLTFNPAAIDVALRPVASGFASPILLTNAGDGSGRRFVVEQTGFVRTIQNGAPSGTPFLNVSGRVVYGGERGLLGLAFHPSFETNGKLYVNYTRSGDGATVIDEYRVTSDPNNVDEAATRRQILVIGQPYSNHNGGMMAFGPDGYLYVGTGDGGSSGDPEERAQNLGTLLGKMLRIDVNGTSSGKAYRIPATNPYAAATAGLDEIWARGLRNPWRWSFDRITGDLWIADVGQGRYEEVNRSTASSGGGRGANYGWDVMEGRHCFEPMSGCSTSGKVLPLIEYPQAVDGTDNCSVTGGYVYRGERFPLLRGGYFFADYCSDRIWVVSATAASPATPTLLPITTTDIVSFGQDEDGELYVVSLGGGISQVIEQTRHPGTGTR